MKKLLIILTVLLSVVTPLMVPSPAKAVDPYRCDATSKTKSGYTSADDEFYGIRVYTKLNYRHCYNMTSAYDVFTSVTVSWKPERKNGFKAWTCKNAMSLGGVWLNPSPVAGYDGDWKKWKCTNSTVLRSYTYNFPDRKYFRGKGDRCVALNVKLVLNNNPDQRKLLPNNCVN
jgi:hypothetical protein